MEQENKITCPHCGSDNCFAEPHGEIESKLCMSCGMTYSGIKKGSKTEEEMDSKSPKIIKELKKVVDDEVWYPATIQIRNKGMIFPVGSIDNWRWSCSKVVSIPLFERMNYPIEGKPGHYYETRLDVENASEFPNDRFIDACKDLGMIKEGLES